MKAIRYILAWILLPMMLAGCLDEYQELNTNPEQLATTDPRYVFTGATMNFTNQSRSHLTGKYGGVMVYMQYLVSASGPSAGYYVSPAKPNEHPQPYSPAYGDYYGTYGLRLDNLINMVIPKKDNAERYADVKAISQILLNYEQWRVLDTYGAAPITEAFRAQSDGNQTPRYDLYQEGIDGTPMYKKIDSEVKAAVETLKASNESQYALGGNDFFYSGDVKKWIKFGNTLRVMVDAGLLVAGHDVGGGGKHLAHNTDDIQDITSRYVASAAFVNFLKSCDDPRLPILVRRNGFGPGNNNKQNDEWFEIFKKEYPDYETRWPQFTGRYVGMSANPDSAATTFNKSAYLTLPYHKEDGSEANLDIRMHSQIESRFYIKNGGIIGNNNMPARAIEGEDFYINQEKMHTFTPLITYPETCLMLAEIAVKKGGSVAGKDAKGWFREGVKASMEQYRDWAKNMFVVAQTSEKAPNYNPVTDEKINAYLARPEFSDITLEKIISQQWVNLYMHPEEMWATWKRTGLPAFKAKPEPEGGVAFLEEIKDAKNVLTIPRRNSLGTPNTLNIANYNTAIDALKKDAKYGSDTDRTEGRIWWDVQ